MPGRYKCNIDAAFSSQFNRTGIGICVCYFDGTFVLVKVVSYPCLLSVDVGEALGLHSALQWLICNSITLILKWTPSRRLMPSMLLGTTLTNLVVSFLQIAPYLAIYFLTIRWSLWKKMWRKDCDDLRKKSLEIFFFFWRESLEIWSWVLGI